MLLANGELLCSQLARGLLENTGVQAPPTLLSQLRRARLFSVASCIALLSEYCTRGPPEAARGDGTGTVPVPSARGPPGGAGRGPAGSAGEPKTAPGDPPRGSTRAAGGDGTGNLPGGCPYHRPRGPPRGAGESTAKGSRRAFGGRKPWPSRTPAHCGLTGGCKVEKLGCGLGNSSPLVPLFAGEGWVSLVPPSVRIRVLSPILVLQLTVCIGHKTCLSTRARLCNAGELDCSCSNPTL